MKYKLLIGDTIDHQGKMLANSIKYLGFDTVYCSNYPNTLEKHLSIHQYDGCVFYALILNENVRNFILNCRKNYPKLRLYAIISTISDSAQYELFKLGVSSCIVMPYVNCIACAEIAVDYYSRFSLIPEIAGFLFKNHFPSTLIGFYFLCFAVKMAIFNPDISEKPSTEIYSEIAERIDSTYENVERGLRVMLSSAFRKGVLLNGKSEQRRIKNKDLFILLAEEFKNSPYFEDIIEQNKRLYPEEYNKLFQGIS